MGKSPLCPKRHAVVVAAAGHWTASGVVQREIKVGRDLWRPLICSAAPSGTSVKTIDQVAQGFVQFISARS